MTETRQRDPLRANEQWWRFSFSLKQWAWENTCRIWTTYKDSLFPFWVLFSLFWVPFESGFALQLFQLRKLIGNWGSGESWVTYWRWWIPEKRPIKLGQGRVGRDLLLSFGGQQRSLSMIFMWVHSASSSSSSSAFHTEDSNGHFWSFITQSFFSSGFSAFLGCVIFNWFDSAARSQVLGWAVTPNFSRSQSYEEEIFYSACEFYFCLI